MIKVIQKENKRLSNDYLCCPMMVSAVKRFSVSNECLDCILAFLSQVLQLLLTLMNQVYFIFVNCRTVSFINKSDLY